jgi:quercetin dioxygenase-like cupin family protein
MTLEVFDYRQDIRNVLITPEIRSRFFWLEPGEVANRHTHDLGHEIFLVLQGKAEFDVDGRVAVLEPGQMCVALAHEMHNVRNVGDEPMILYLSVTPHVEPTHTHWDQNGNQKPPVYGASTAPERAGIEIDSSTRAEQIDSLKSGVEILSATVQESAAKISQLCDDLARVQHPEEREQAEATIDAMWEDMYRIHRALRSVQLDWNEVAANNGRRES